MADNGNRLAVACGSVLRRGGDIKGDGCRES
jgi:hypothetical protein